MGFFYKRKTEIQDVFFDQKQEVVSLRKKRFVIEFSKEYFGGVFDNHKHFIFSILIVGFVIIAGSFFRSIRADTALFYAGQCLGGWENPKNAEGKPDLQEDAAGELYTKKNSAVLNNTQGDLYCGSFIGEAPKESAPTNFVVKARWTIDDGTVLHAVEPEVIIEEILPTENATPVPSESNSGSELIENNDSVPADSEPAIPEIQVEQSQTQSLLHYFAKTVLAQEDTAIESSELRQDLQANESPEIVNEEQVLQEALIQENQIVEDPVKPFLLLEYSLDGVEWNVVAEVTHNNWKKGTFDFPLDLASWDQIEKLQLRLVPQVTFDTMPVIYLDALWIEAEYAPLAVVEVKDIQNSDPKKLHAVSVRSINQSFTGYVLSDSDQGEILHIKTPQAMQIRFYRENDPLFMFLAPSAESETVIPLYNLEAGTIIAVGTKDSEGCVASTLTECRELPGYLGEITLEIRSLLEAQEEDNQEAIIETTVPQESSASEIDIPNEVGSNIDSLEQTQNQNVVPLEENQNNTNVIE